MRALTSTFSISRLLSRSLILICASVLTKPVIEHSLLSMLGIARERRQQLRRRRRSEIDDQAPGPEATGGSKEPAPLQHEQQQKGGEPADQPT